MKEYKTLRKKKYEKMSYIKNNIEQQANCCCICSTFAWNAEAKQLTVCVYVCEYFAY